MEYANCARCKKMFLRVNNPICPECEKEEEKQFQIVKEYLDGNPANSLSQVSEETGVSVKRILKFIRDGRIEMTEGISAENVLRCGQCGRPIAKGVFCDSCQVQYNMVVNEMIQDKEKVKESKGMHSLPSALDKRNK